jgi:aminopeptidase YwaD
MMRIYGRFVALILLAALALAPACSNDDAGAPEALLPAQTATVAAEGQASAVPGGATAPASGNAAQQAGEQPDAARAFSHVQKLAAEIGARPSGTAEEHAAAEYIAGELRASGYDVELQRFAVSSWVSRAVSVRIEAPAARSLEAQALTNSRPGTATGQLVASGLGRPEDFPATVRGNIALIERGELTFQEKAANAAAAGAAAAIIFNNADGLFTGDLRDGAPAFPVLAISGADGRALREQAQRGAVRASVSFDGGVTNGESFNVVARPQGRRCQVVMGGHYDTVPGAPGASDNASGTAAVIEMARIQALRGNPERACFVAFASEETGLDGSRAFVRALSADDKKALRFMLNFDMVAVGTEWLLIGSPSLQQQGRTLIEEMGLQSRSIVPLGFSSDHASFNNAGIPALFLHRSNDPLLHTPEDVTSRISVDQLGEAMRIGLALLKGIDPA